MMKINNKTKLALMMIVSLSAGSLSAYECLDSAKAKFSTPDSDFGPISNGNVEHKKTGLMWRVCPEKETYSAGSCSIHGAAHATMNWKQALKQAEVANANNLGGYSDWRLPNIKELASIIEFACEEPALNTKVFPASYENFWSSTIIQTESGVYNQAYTVSFKKGRFTYDDYKNEKYAVRLVRSSGGIK